LGFGSILEYKLELVMLKVVMQLSLIDKEILQLNSWLAFLAIIFNIIAMDNGLFGNDFVKK